MLNLSITLRDKATPAVNRVAAFMRSDAAQKIIGYEAQRTVREHFQELDETRANRLGGARTHYYGSARRGTGFYFDGADVVVNIHQIGIALHYYGGNVAPGVGLSSATGQPTKYLTIPVAPEAHGKRASDFDLVVLWGRDGPYGLAQAERVEVMTLRHGVRVVTRPGKMLFRLSKGETFAPDPAILPEPGEIGENATRHLGNVIRRRFEGQDADFTVEASTE